MDVEVQEMPEFRVGSVRHVGPYNQVSQAFGTLSAVAGPAGLFQLPGAVMMAIYHDDPFTTPPGQLRSDAAIVVQEPTAVPAALIEQRVPAGRYALTVHIGPYEELGRAWEVFLSKQLPACGHRVRPGASYEIYRNNPMNVPKRELRTDLYTPIL